MTWITPARVAFLLQSRRRAPHEGTITGEVYRPLCDAAQAANILVRGGAVSEEPNFAEASADGYGNPGTSDFGELLAAIRQLAYAQACTERRVSEPVQTQRKTLERHHERFQRSRGEA